MDNADPLRMTNNRPTSKVMSNADVLRMMKSPAPTSEIIRQINITLPGFQLFPEDIRKLRDRHVPEAVIDAMMARNQLDPVQSPVQNKDDQPPQRHPRRGAGLIVKEGTPVRLRLTENLNPPYLRLDDKVHFEVLEDVAVANGSGRFVVTPREATALGTITAVNQTKLMNRYGTVEVALDGVTLANGDKIALRGTENAKRHTRPGLVVFITAPVGAVIQPKNPVWMTPLGREGIDANLTDGSDFVVWTDGTADLDSADFEQR
jgi:hypothetical protein